MKNSMISIYFWPFKKVDSKNRRVLLRNLWNPVKPTVLILIILCLVSSIFVYSKNESMNCFSVSSSCSSFDTVFSGLSLFSGFLVFLIMQSITLNALYNGYVIRPIYEDRPVSELGNLDKFYSKFSFMFLSTIYFLSLFFTILIPFLLILLALSK